ncbi:MAG: 50S ribosomal protein L24 [Clostridiales bacterium]|jgi:large subunit ribosomal protein L24|nr:50S ribosomal protein L24 [Clostridiales bacterium]
MKLKRGDQVIVIAGKDKGKKGRIIFVDRKNRRVVVESVNMVTKHQKPNRGNQNGGIVKKEAPIHVSNVMFLHKGEPTRIGYKIEESADGIVTKTRIAKKTGEVID